jgi:hypothetical protein
VRCRPLPGRPPRRSPGARGDDALVALSHKAPWRPYPPGRLRLPRGGVRLLAHIAHASTGGQEPSAAAPASFQGNESLLLDLRPPAHCPSCLGVEDGLHRTVRLDRCRRRGFIIRTDCRVARVGPTTPTRAGRLTDASVDPTEARKATTRRFRRSDCAMQAWERRMVCRSHPDSSRRDTAGGKPVQ